ncbi:MAG: winged helix-turn-helix transcriptional regulator [Deltaproteobacteria bacterium]|nr:winged helix-turn-helix transcriptional regulator [Deltaproteobacteria bacterium]
MKDEDVEHVAALLKTMSHPIRMRILCLLQDNELTVGDLRSEVKTSNANVSQHLTILRNKQMIASRKEANYIYNRIADKRILELISTMKNLFCPAK